MVEASTVIVYAGGYLTIVFLSVCLGERRATGVAHVCIRSFPTVPLFSEVRLSPAAAGLYYIAELIEEYTQV